MSLSTTAYIRIPPGSAVDGQILHLFFLSPHSTARGRGPCPTFSAHSPATCSEARQRALVRVPRRSGRRKRFSSAQPAALLCAEQKTAGFNFMFCAEICLLKFRWNPWAAHSPPCFLWGFLPLLLPWSFKRGDRFRGNHTSIDHRFIRKSSDPCLFSDGFLFSCPAASFCWARN